MKKTVLTIVGLSVVVYFGINYSSEDSNKINTSKSSEYTTTKNDEVKNVYEDNHSSKDTFNQSSSSSYECQTKC